MRGTTCIFDVLVPELDTARHREPPTAKVLERKKKEKKKVSGEVLGHEAVLHTSCIHGGGHGGKGRKCRGEEVGYSAGGEVAERVLQDGVICMGMDVPVSCQR